MAIQPAGPRASPPTPGGAALAPKTEAKTEVAAAAPAAAVETVRPQAAVEVRLATPEMQTAPADSLTLQHYVAMNEELIASYAQKLSEALKQKGMDAGSAGFVYDIDNTGYELQVCMLCGRVGHDAAPTMVRQENPEIDMLDESLIVFLEVAKRVGVSYGVMAHDEQVLPLREVAQTGVGTSHDTVLARYKAFKSRNDDKLRSVVDGQMQDWMTKEIANWEPSWATRKMVGDPADAEAVAVGTGLLNKAEGEGVSEKFYTMVKGQPAENSLRGIEADAKNDGVAVRGIAIGDNSADIKASHFKKTAEAKDMHDLRELVLRAMILQVDPKTKFDPIES